MKTRQRRAAQDVGSRAAAVRQRRKNNTGMPDAVKTQMETALQADFSEVRVHPNSSQAPAVGALAYTQGHDVHFAPGQFQPESTAGQRLLGHELTHVVQQRQGRVRPTIEVGGMPVNDDVSLEKEADQLGSKVHSVTPPAQTKARHGTAGSVQRQVPEDEMLQGKFITQRQTLDDEEMLS